MPERQTIWKYMIDVNVASFLKCTMPAEAKFLHCDIEPSYENNGTIVCFWMLVNPDRDKTQRTFHVVGTGHPIEHINGRYRGTVINPPFAWHLLEEY